MSNTINVEVNNTQSYSIEIGRKLWEHVLEFCRDRFRSERVFLVVDEQVEKFHGEKILENLENYFEQVHKYVVPSGEASKSVTQWNKIVDFVLENKVKRNTPLFAVGGGVTGDLGGFAAASVMRGIPLVHLPTTLLAMVDSSIGGKTGVNHATGKNLIGAFYQPEAVFADVEFLTTLEDKEWINGISEILKYGAIRDQEILETVKSLTQGNRFENPEAWMPLIRKSAGIKVDIVQEDVLEAGTRAFLNFGHTFGHAMEALSGYGHYSHGEAVFVGMLAALYASEKLGAPVNRVRFEPFYALYDLSTQNLKNRIDDLIERMYRDKKVKSDAIRLVLLKAWEKPYLEECTDHEFLNEAWTFALKQFDHQ